MEWVDVYWDEDIQKAIDKATQGVRIHNCANPDVSRWRGRRSGIADFDIGINTINITNEIRNRGSLDKPFEIVGIIGENEEIEALRDDMPTIRGTSTAFLVAGKECKDVGIFHIGPGCFVKISGLHLIQDVVTDHGSATIANLVDNNMGSSLAVSSCKIRTIATAAISVRSNVALEASPAPAHDITISDCEVTGIEGTGGKPGAGNFSSVNLGYWGRHPLEVSTFQVSGCNLNSLKLGAAVWYVSGHSDSMFLVAGNKIGTGNVEGTAVGVSFISYPIDAEHPISLPHGTIAIVENEMKIGTYLPKMGAAGGLVWAHNVPRVRTIISHNTIEMVLAKTNSADPYVCGIAYEQLQETTLDKFNSAHSVSADIHNNSVSSLLWEAPRYGIKLGNYAHLVRITDNQLSQFAASTALIQINENASRNIVVGNTFGSLSSSGEAGMICNGSENSICDNDFSESGIPGGGKKVCVRLGEHSKDNLVVLKHTDIPKGTDPKLQIVNPDASANIVKVIPEFQLASAIRQSRSEAWWDRIKGSLLELQFALEHVRPEPSPGPPVARRTISRLRQEQVANVAKAGD